MFETLIPTNLRSTRLRTGSFVLIMRSKTYTLAFTSSLYHMMTQPTTVTMTDSRPGRNLRLSFAPIRIPPPFTMPRSISSQSVNEDDEEDDSIIPQQAGYATPASPTAARRFYSARTSELDLRRRMPSKQCLRDEHSSLLAFGDGHTRSYTAPNTGRPRFSRRSSRGSLRMPENHSRASSWGLRLASALGSGRKLMDNGMGDSKASIFMDERVWYDQFTSTDWVHDSIADAFRVRDLRARKDLRGRISAWFDGAQGWILVAIIGCITACVAFFANISETCIFDYKGGYCREGWYFSKRKCCYGKNHCPSWKTWGERMSITGIDRKWIDFVAYVFFVILFSVGACFLTLLTKTEIPSAYSLSTLDENLGADKQKHRGDTDDKVSLSPLEPEAVDEKPGTMIYYPAAGSGVAEVKVILSGFVVHGYLGFRTLVVKTIALILSVASGLSLGKEGPYVHVATCVGNIACRLFSKYNHNDGKRREILSASAASGVGVAFGAPISGVLFSLEEVSYYFPPKTLFRTFFCCIVASLSLKFLNPYGTGKIVIFEVRYVTDWRAFEMVVFILLGMLGGALGALFIKASRIWVRTFRGQTPPLCSQIGGTYRIIWEQKAPLLPHDCAIPWVKCHHFCLFFSFRHPRLTTTLTSKFA